MSDIWLAVADNSRQVSVFGNIIVMTLASAAALLVWSFEPKRISPGALAIFLAAVAVFFMRRFILAQRGGELVGWDWGSAGATIVMALAAVILMVGVLGGIEEGRRTREQSERDGQSVAHIKNPTDSRETLP